jgi:hypothetical protein
MFSQIYAQNDFAYKTTNLNLALLFRFLFLSNELFEIIFVKVHLQNGQVYSNALLLGR